MAPISDNDGNAVGVIQVELDKENPNTRQVIADVKLGQRLLPPPASSQQRPDPETLIYDQPLKAWFAVKDKSIEAASQSGESVVLGSVPLDVFFNSVKVLFPVVLLLHQLNSKLKLCRRQQITGIHGL
ncbi:hypothetical protein RQN30_03980 [Arcanobacterium hippocoleae]